jgi:hypothetical protein
MVGPRVGCYGLRLRGGNRACWWNRATISPLERRLLGDTGAAISGRAGRGTGLFTHTPTFATHKTTFGAAWDS